ncbi:MAG: TonB family protein, partial [Elusimicrobia bacterium]|nr:TonB family protein [Elusimicrobiota bacterium]
PGPLQPEKIKAGLPDADPQVKPQPKRRVLSAAGRARLEKKRELARIRAAERAEERRVAREAAMIRAAELRAQREEARRQAAEALRIRREEARARAAALAAERAEAARLRALQVAQARAERARQRAELEHQLAALPNPEEELSFAQPSGGYARARRGRTRADRPGESSVGGVDRAGAAAALESDLRDAPASGGAGAGAPGLAGAFQSLDFAPGNPGFARDGRGGGDAENSRPAGGGFGEGGGPVSWSVEGPVGNRKVLRRVLPKCPDWVSQRGLELTVQLKFQVLDDGTIKRSVVIKRTSGFPDLDRLAIEALQKWKFQPLHNGVGMSNPDVWGIVSFRFMMG